MDEAAQLARLQELQRLIGAAEAELAAGMAAFVVEARDQVLGAEFATDEIAVALRCGRGRVLGQIRLAEGAQTLLPATWAAWRSGTIDAHKAGLVLDATERLTDPELLAGFDADAAERAASNTGPQLAGWLARAVARLEPDQAAARHQRARTQRRVGVQLDLDGMGSLWAITSAVELAAIDLRLTRLATDLGADDPRSLQQRRLDVFVDLLLGRSTNGETTDASVERCAAVGTAAPVVAVTVPIQSLLGLDDTPAEVSGGGALVPASLAREILAQPGALVYRLLTDPAGQLLDVAKLGRFPSDLLGFAVDARDRSCVFPSCQRAAQLCDADHTIAHPDGPTSYANLGCLCRRHHRLKTSGRVQLKQIEPGLFEWRMRSGHTHTVRPEPQPVGEWPTACEEPPPPEPLHHTNDLAALLADNEHPETLTTEELDALLSA